MLAFVLESHDYDFWTNLAKRKFRYYIFDLYWKRLLAYVVRFIIKIAGVLVSFGIMIASMLGSHCNHDWRPMWSRLWLKFQAYLVPIIRNHMVHAYKDEINLKLNIKGLFNPNFMAFTFHFWSTKFMNY